jgi:hypothetical protein
MGEITPMASTQNLNAGAISSVRQCPFCGKTIARSFTQCPVCRESLPDVQKSASLSPGAKRNRDHRIRRGLLYMLLAALFHYFAAGYSAMFLPVTVNAVVTFYLTPFFFLGGLGLFIYGLLTKH